MKETTVITKKELLKAIKKEMKDYDNDCEFNADDLLEILAKYGTKYQLIDGYWKKIN